MALVARGLSGALGSYPATPAWGAVVFVWLFLSTSCTGKESMVPGAAERREGAIEGEDGRSSTPPRKESWGRGCSEPRTSLVPQGLQIPVCQTGGGGGIPRCRGALPRPC